MITHSNMTAIKTTYYGPTNTETERDCWWQIARAAYYAYFKYVAEYIRIVQLCGHRHPDDTKPAAL